MSDARAGGLTLAVFGAVLTAFGLLGVSKALEWMPEGRASAAWPTVTGTVEEMRVTRRARSSDVGITYRYEVDGQRYRSSRIWFVRSGRQNASSLVDRYPEGSEVRVHYDPSDPSTAVLQPGATVWGVARDSFAVLLILGAGLALTGFGLVHAVRG